MRKYGLKIVALLLSAVFVFAVFPSLKSNADMTVSFDNKTGTLTITGNGEVRRQDLDAYFFTIPQSLSDVKEVVIEKGITRIDDDVFNNGSNISSIVIPDSVTSIGCRVFLDCVSLESIVIPDSVTSIGDNAFLRCSSLKSINIPSGVTIIDEYTFLQCTSLTSIEIPESVTSIGDYAFYGCTGFTSIEIPKSVTSIGDYAFSGCTGFTSIEIPESVTSIGDYAFWGCTGFTSIEIPDSITSIGKGAFYECANLEEVYMDTKLVKQCSDNDVFMSCPSNMNFYYYYNATYSCEHGIIDGNKVTFGTDKLTITPEENYELVEVSYTFAGSNEKTIIIPDASGDYRMPDLDLSVTNRNIVVTASFKLIQKTVTFCDEDGTTILQSGKVDATTIPTYGGDTPTKPADDQYTYTFAGWTDGTNEYKPTDTLPIVTDDATYTAMYTGTTNVYTVTFTDDKGKELLSSDVKYGEAPKYSGDTPAKAETDKYTYTFAGWIDGANNKYGPTDTLPEVKGDVTYKAVFTETAKPEPDEPQKPVDPTTTDPQKTDEPSTVNPQKTDEPATVDPVDPVVPVDPDEPEVAPVKPVVDPDIKPVTTEVEVQKPGVYYLNSLTGDGVTTDVVAAIKRTEDDVHCVEYFGNAEVDGTPMTVGEQILVGSGSTIITIKKEFLATIGEGNHTLRVLFTDGGSITIEFTVKAATNNGASVPATGETIGMTTVLGACLILGAAGVVVAFATRKRKEDA